jgi:bifunctional non-homologous end joining protein LigD
VREFQRVARRVKRPLIVDGEIVALDEDGRPAGFQRLQGRIHLTGARDVERVDLAQPVAFLAFDLLRDGDEDIRGLPLLERRRRLERHLHALQNATLRLSEMASRDGRALYNRAIGGGWEGLIAKDATSVYQSGRRSPAWRKLKVLRQQEFVVGGWTQPRQTRQCFGALLLGVYEDGALRYVGHTGTGFDQRELERVHKLLEAREVDRSPFADRIKTNERAHWVRPELVAEIRYTELTADRKLRHPVYLGLRDDKKARDVVLEGGQAPEARERRRPEAGDRRPEDTGRRKRVASGVSRKSDTKAPSFKIPNDLAALAAHLQQLEEARKDAAIQLPNGDRLNVTNLAKIFWPDGKITKGELLRYYTLVSPLILPAVADRPLVMKRFPNGVADKKAFYQQRSRDERPPSGVRVETLPPEVEPIKEDNEPDPRRLVGGSLTTLLYMVQLAAISQDPWFSRIQSPLDADYVAIDLDPSEGATFGSVLDVARWVRDELDTFGVPGVPKTSGSRGLHIYIPLPPHTSYESGLLLCQIIATIVSSKHPRVATIERMVRGRARGTVYVDYLQNILGKTLATAYSVRASDFAGVSTPLTWKEVDEGVDPRDFTIRTALQRFQQVGDLWARLRQSKPVDLRGVLKRFG